MSLQHATGACRSFVRKAISWTTSSLHGWRTGLQRSVKIHGVVHTPSDIKVSIQLMWLELHSVSMLDMLQYRECKGNKTHAVRTEYRRSRVEAALNQHQQQCLMLEHGCSDHYAWPINPSLQMCGGPVLRKLSLYWSSKAHPRCSTELHTVSQV